MAVPDSGGRMAARALRRAGVHTLFTLPGGHIFSLLGAAPGEGLRLIQTRHEEAAVLAAEGHALASGDIGVAAVTAGPGFTNSLPGIAEAQQAGVPVLVIAGRTAVAQRGRGAVQDMEQLDVAKTLAKWAGECLETARIPEFVNRAIHAATSGAPGAAYLEIPQDVLTGVAPGTPGAPDLGALPARNTPTDSDVGALVDLLDGARRPVVLAGSGAFFSKAGPALGRFASASGIPVITTSAARGLIDDDDPMCLGGLVHGGVALASADVALVLGSRFNANLLYGGPPLFPPDQRIAQVDIEPENLGGPRTPEVAFTGDVTATLDALGAAWNDEPDRWSGWVRDASGAAAASLQAWRDDAATPSEGIHPGLLAGEVARFASDIGASLVADGGDSSIWGLAMGRAHKPGSMLYIGSALGTLGIGMPFALGIGAARRDELVVVFTGDGAFGLSAMEVDTAARYGPGVIVVVVNNGGWGDVSHEAGGQTDPGPSRERASTMRYGHLGTAVGGHGETIDAPEEIGPALGRALEHARSGRVAVIDARCDPRAVSTFMRGMGALGLM